MPFGVSTKLYGLVVFSGFGFAAFGSICAHLILRPDRSPPNMAPYIEAQREIIKKVKNRKKGMESTESKIEKKEDDDDIPLIKTSYGEYRLDELDPETGMPKNDNGGFLERPKLQPGVNIPKFWMYVPVPMESVKDLVDEPIVEIPAPERYESI